MISDQLFDIIKQIVDNPDMRIMDALSDEDLDYLEELLIGDLIHE